MKLTHRSDIFMFSTFDEARDLDFHGFCLVRPEGNVLIDPVPMGAHDRNHVLALGGVAWIVVTNSDHVRAAPALAHAFSARIAGPAGERDAFPLSCDRWLEHDEQLDRGLRIHVLHGSKTPGELALVMDDTTLITGDLIRGHRGGALNLLPDAKLRDPAAARASVTHLVRTIEVEAVLVGDGWPVFRDGQAPLEALLSELGH